MKVIGAGYGRTGTKSLQIALEVLGFGKCYHMEELMRNPEGIKHWEDAYNNNPVDWDTLFSNYNSIVDFPGSMYYKELHTHYPDAKVILSIRDPERWYNSVKSTIYSFDPGPAIKINMLIKMLFSSTARNLFKVINFQKKAIWKKYFEGRFEDKEYAINKFNKHIEEVMSIIPNNKLLIFEAKDGWKPLCNFLEVGIPSEPYPFNNKKEDFSVWAKGIVKEIL